MRALSFFVVAAFVVLAACKKDDDTGTSDSTTENSTRSVVCGKGKCTNDDYCCGGDGWGDPQCSVVCEAPTQHAMYCDDATDCPTGSVCCYVSSTGGVISSTCDTSCAFAADRGQLCKTGSTECGAKGCKGLSVQPGGLFSCQ